MTPSQQQFRADALALIQREWKAMRAPKGDAVAWWWVEKLTTWNGAHDWSVQRIQYDRPLPSSGPVFQDATPEGSALRLRFRHVDGGLVSNEQADKFEPVDPEYPEQLFLTFTGVL